MQQKQLNGHKNIVRYIDSQAGGMKGGGYEVFILMEFCSGMSTKHSIFSIFLQLF